MNKYNYIYFYLLIAICVNAFPSHAQDRGTVVDQVLDEIEEDGMMTNTITPAGNQAGGGFTAPVSVAVKESIRGLDAKSSTLKNVFDEISQRTGLTFVASEQIQGLVALSVEEISATDLLSVLAHVYGFAFDRQGDVVLFMTPSDYQVRMGKEFQKGLGAAMIKVKYADLGALEPLARALKTESGKIFLDYRNRQIVVLDTASSVNAIKNLIKERDVILKTKTIQLENVAVAEIRDEVEKRILAGGLGKAEFNEEAQSITVTDEPEAVERLVQFIKSQDQKLEIVLEGKIVRITLNEEHSEGVDWEAILSDYQQIDFNGTDQEIKNSEQLQVGTLSREDYDVLLEALDTVGEVEELMPLEVKAASGQEQTFIIDTGNPFSRILAQGKDFQLDSQGFKLNTQLMAEASTDEQNISMQFLFQLFWTGGEDSDGQATVIRAHNPVKFEVEGDTHLIFGGLLKRQTISRTRKVPLLGDLPVLGGAFRRDRVRPDNTEYIIFLKPKIEKTSSL